MKPKKWKNKNFWVALKNSLNGIKQTFQNERNFKIQFVFAFFAMIAGVFFKITATEWMILLLTIGMVLFAELVNTAIEILLDLYSENYHEKIKIAKDIASGAVLITAIVAVIVGGMLFLPKIGIN